MSSSDLARNGLRELLPNAVCNERSEQSFRARKYPRAPLRHALASKSWLPPEHSVRSPPELTAARRSPLSVTLCLMLVPGADLLEGPLTLRKDLSLPNESLAGGCSEKAKADRRPQRAAAALCPSPLTRATRVRAADVLHPGRPVGEVHDLPLSELAQPSPAQPSPAQPSPAQPTDGFVCRLARKVIRILALPWIDLWIRSTLRPHVRPGRSPKSNSAFASLSEIRETWIQTPITSESAAENRRRPSKRPESVSPGAQHGLWMRDVANKLW